MLVDKTSEITGTVKELAEKFSLEICEVAGFIDGINTSLEKMIDVEALEEDSAVEMKIVWETLYKNMLNARAPWLYELPEWDGILTEEKRAEIEHEFRASLQAVSTKVSRNALCPCGSGKKYKKCCGANED
ncbi:MAG: SEC-C domain-containing protein [Clostridia bacterium]|nr:SEC-C domain-containing protein [Clostridia bacterium]